MRPRHRSRRAYPDHSPVASNAVAVPTLGRTWRGTVLGMPPAADQVPARVSHLIGLMVESHSFDRMLGYLGRTNPDVEGHDSGW